MSRYVNEGGSNVSSREAGAQFCLCLTRDGGQTWPPTDCSPLPPLSFLPALLLWSLSRCTLGPIVHCSEHDRVSSSRLSLAPWWQRLTEGACPSFEEAGLCHCCVPGRGRRAVISMDSFPGVLYLLPCGTETELDSGDREAGRYRRRDG